MGRGVTGGTWQRCNHKNPESGNLCRLEVGHRGGHRWWIRGKAPVEERCGHKSRRTGLVCTMRTAHKGSHSYGAPAGHEAQSERWFDCSNCDDQGFKILHATVYVELCDECQKNDPPAATYQATAGGSGVQTAPSYPLRLGNTTEEKQMLVLSTEVARGHPHRNLGRADSGNPREHRPRRDRGRSRDRHPPRGTGRAARRRGRARRSLTANERY